MTTRKQVMDSYNAKKVADDQQRASNGQFGSGGGEKAAGTQRRAAISHEGVERAREAQEKYKTIPEQTKAAAIQAQEHSAGQYRTARAQMGIHDTCAGIKGILGALDAAHRG